MIWLLGYYNDKAVIDRLIEDAKDIDVLSSVMDDYSYEFTVKLIGDYKTDLFNLCTKLIDEGKEHNAKLIDEIRLKASNHLKKDKIENKKWLSRPFGVDF